MYIHLHVYVLLMLGSHAGECAASTLQAHLSAGALSLNEALEVACARRSVADSSFSISRPLMTVDYIPHVGCMSP